MAFVVTKSKMKPLLSGHTPLLSGRGHRKSTWNGHFYCCQPALNGHLWLNSTTQHARHLKYERLPRIATHKFSIFTLKNVTWWTYLIGFPVQYCFLFRFVCTELFLLDFWFLQIWVAIYVRGTMINWSTLKKKYSKRFHRSFEWHLTPHMTLSIETCIRRTPVLICIKRTLRHSPRVSV